MRDIGRTTAVLAATLFLTIPAFAQDASVAPAGPQMPKWEFGGGLGLLAARSGEFTSSCACGYEYWRQMAEYRFDVGRYWTTHVKTSLSVGLSPRFNDYENGVVIVNGVSRFVSNERTARATTIAPSVTYQFFENAFMHPYVTGGVRVSAIDERRFRAARNYPPGATPDPVSPPEERRTIVLARPFVSAGMKSYINEQAFVRSEALVALGAKGITQVTLHLGVGVDF
jgi:hypothetical protein